MSLDTVSGVEYDQHQSDSRRIKDEYENSRACYPWHGKPLSQIPESANERPSPAFLEWHREQVYRS